MARLCLRVILAEATRVLLDGIWEGRRLCNLTLCNRLLERGSIKRSERGIGGRPSSLHLREDDLALIVHRSNLGIDLSLGLGRSICISSRSLLGRSLLALGCRSRLCLSGDERAHGSDPCLNCGECRKNGRNVHGGRVGGRHFVLWCCGVKVSFGLNQFQFYINLLPIS